MPLPAAEQVGRFIDLYLRRRHQKQYSTLGQIQQTGKTLGSFIANSLSFFSNPAEEKQPQPTDSQAICLRLKQTFAAAKDVSDWIALVLNLRKEADEALKRCLLKSSLCKTLHAAATFILDHLQQEEAFKIIIEDLKNDLLPLVEPDMTGDMSLKHLPIQRLTVTQKENLMKLANLGDAEAVEACMHFKLTKAPLPEEEDLLLTNTAKLKTMHINAAIPLCYQPQYFLLYHLRYAPEGQAFEDFISLPAKKAQARL